MGLTLQEVLERALKKLKVPRFQHFKKKLSQWKIRKEYKNIPKDELTGKDPEYVAGLIIQNFKYAYGAELTLTVLEDIDEKKVREELQHDLREVDIPGHGLGTSMFTDKVNFIENHQSLLIRKITDVDPVLRDLRDQLKEYEDVRSKKTSLEKMKELCDMIRRWEDDGKFIAYTIIKMHEEELIKRIEGQKLMWKYPGSRYLYRVTFIERNKLYLINNVTNVDPVLHDLRDLKLLTQKQYNNLMKKKTSEQKMRQLCDLIGHWENDGKLRAYEILQKCEEKLLKDIETWRHVTSDSSCHFVNRHRYDLMINIKEVNPVIDDLRANHLLNEEQYGDLRAMTTPEVKMKRLCDIFWHQSNTIKDQFYISLWRYNYTVMNRLSLSDRKPTPSFSNIPETSTDLDFSLAEDSEECVVLHSGSSEESKKLGIRNTEMKEEDVICELCEMDDGNAVDGCIWEGTSIRLASMVTRAFNSSGTPTSEMKRRRVIRLQKPSNSDLRMGLTLQEVLERAVKKLKDPSFQHFKKKLSRWEVRKEYKNIPKDELTGKDPEHVAGLIIKNFKYAYGAELTLAVLEDIDEKKVREELQHDLREVDIAGHGLGTSMFTDQVNFIENHQSLLIRKITDVDPVLRDLRDQLTRKEYEDVRSKKTSRKKMKQLCDMIRRWEDDGKYLAYTIIKMHEEELIKRFEGQKLMWKYPGSRYLYRVTFIERNKLYLINKVTNVDPVLHDLRDLKLLTQKQYNNLMKKKTSEQKMRQLCDLIGHWENDGKLRAYEILQKCEEKLLKDIETWRHVTSDSSCHFVNRHRYDLMINIKEVNPVIDDLRANHLLNEEQYGDLRAMTTPEEKMKRLCDIFWHQSGPIKDQFYISLWRYNYTVMNRLSLSDRKLTPSFSYIPETSTDLDFSLAEDSEECVALHSGSSEESKKLGIRNTEMKEEDVICELCEMMKRRRDIRLQKPSNSDLRMGLTLQEVLERAVKKLKDPSFQHFKNKLSRWEVRKEYKNIPKDELTGKDPELVAGLIIKNFKYAYGAELTLAVLEDIDEKKVREELQHALREVDIAGHGLGTSMFTDKVNFIENHQSLLIRKITVVDPVLRDLRDQLTRKQYKNLKRKKTSRKKMKQLCDMIRRWEDDGKYLAYTIIKMHEEELIKRFEGQKLMWKYPGSRYLYRVTFIERNKSYLINNVTNVDPVLHDLHDLKLLTQEKFNDMMKKRTSRQKMRELCDIIRCWENDGKLRAYVILQKHEQKLLKDMEIEELWTDATSDSYYHFVDRHRYLLMINIKEVDPVIDDLRANHLLNEEQYEDLQAMTTPEEKMKHLYDIFWHQSGPIKDQFYISLWRYNYTVINMLQISDSKPTPSFSYIPRTSQDLDFSKAEDGKKRLTLPSGFFVDSSRYVPNEEQYGDLQAMTTPKRYYYKYQTGNRKKTRKPTPSFSNIPETSADLDFSKAEDSEAEDSEAEDSEAEDSEAEDSEAEDGKEFVALRSGSSEESKKLEIRNTEMREAVSCELCEMSQDSVEVITPTMIGSTYSLSMNSPGLYRCSESEIQFHVTQSVTIEYELESWSNYTEILQNLYGGYEIIGPLFNIKSRLEPNVVSAVYLPHCLCLGGFMGDKSIIKCFHYKDDNLALETPTRMEAMYAVLENPTFSCFGVILYPLSILQEIRKLIPCHGMALLFCNTITREDLSHRYRIHLYLLPRIHTLEKEVADNEERYSFQKIHKPPQTKSLYYNKEYRIKGPRTARVIPKTLMFESHCPSEVYAFTEISIQGEKNTEVDVSIHPEDKNVTVWETVVNADEMLGLPLAMSQLTIQPGDPRLLPEQSDHFVDRHRADLIRMISVVDLVVDDLLNLNLLTYEQYDTVISQDTNAKQMRKLYDYIRAWGNDDKDKVYQCLRQHNCPIIKQLENKGPKDHSKSHTLEGSFKCNLY
ncbi:uncharacterized protein LOC122927086 [Bufo gargarizans]|uniref:uncharacterized protein LOC122927086 n=1 Tax=Bufo gargarizans TaxID=30331 RepID=UPI001CF58B45|nr:uncharacterized protein LOC122927086 [Bufo gargarizans]